MKPNAGAVSELSTVLLAMEAAGAKADDGLLSLGRGERLYRQLRLALANGSLAIGDRLPSGRLLSKELGLARGTVTVALERLVVEGLLVSRRGSGTFVAETLVAAEHQNHSSRAQQAFRPEIANLVATPDIDQALADDVLDLRPGRPSVDAFPLQAWRRALASAARASLSPDYTESLGEPALRAQIASFLRRVRGLSVVDQEVLVSNGAMHGLSLLAQVLLRPGDRVAVEQPGYPHARQSLMAQGLVMVDVPVDEQGLDVTVLERQKPAPRLVVVTPAHQFPLGCALSMPRRLALIEWARRNDALIVEDDYDGEFRYDIAPLPPMAGLAPDCVAYLGTFSKSLFPALRLGFVIAHPTLLTAMARRRALTEYATSPQAQLALAHFIEHSEFERYLQRMRRVYAGRRAALADAVSGTGLTLTGLESGLHATVALPVGVEAEAISARLLKDGIAVPPLQRYHTGPTARCAAPHSDGQALVLGYADASESLLADAARRIDQLAQTMR